MDTVKLQVNLEKQANVLAKALLPFIGLTASRHDIDLGISLLGFSSRKSYIKAFTKDSRYGEMLSVILLLFILENDDDRKLIWDSIVFYDKTLEKRLKGICGIDDQTLSAQELQDIWDLK